MNTAVPTINAPSGALVPSDVARRAVQRAYGKADRQLLTDAIQQFAGVRRSERRGQHRPGMTYRNMTAMVYRPAGLNALQRRAKAGGEDARDAMSEGELEFLRVAERTTADLLRLGMAEGRSRKAIKADVRAHVDRLAKVIRPARTVRCGKPTFALSLRQGTR